MVDVFGKAFAAFLLISFGASAVIVVERFGVIKPMCLVTDEVYSAGGWNPSGSKGR